MDADPSATDEIQGDLRGVLPAGTRLQKYELISVLGHGSFGITYRARDAQLERDVAIKEYLPATLALREDGTRVVPRSTELSGDFVWGRDRFLGEARTLAKLGHAPAIVRVYDFLEANGTAYMVMALVEGETLESRLKHDGSLPAPVVEKVLYSLLNGLEQIHKASFLHRDIKPANILLDTQDNPTLIDFGASRAAMAGRSTAMTAVYTPGYAAVEQQMTLGRQGPWTDIYGLSTVLYEAITGAPPPGAVDRMYNDTCTPLLQIAPAGFSPALLSGIDAGLSVRAEQRPQSIADWRQLLKPEASAREQTVVVPRRRSAQPAEPPATPTPPASVASTPTIAAPAKRRTALWVAIAVAIVLVAAGGYWVPSLLQDRATQRVAADKEAKARAAEAAQRQADADAAARRRTEEEARRKAADAEAQRKAAETLAKAEAEQRKADEEAARQKAELEAQQKADAETRATAEAAAARAYKEFSDWCFDSNATDEHTIQGCSAVVASSQETQENKGTAFYNRGLAYENLTQHDSAIESYSQAINLKPNHADAFINRGVAYEHLNRYDLAVHDYDQAIKLKPDDSTSFVNRSNAYIRLKQFDRAIQDCNQAIKLKPDDADAYFNRGNAYLSLNQYDRAIQDFGQAIRLNPNDAMAYDDRATAYEKKGQLKLAKADRDKAELLRTQGH